MVGRSMTVYRNTSRQAAAHANSPDSPAATQDNQTRTYGSQNAKAVSKLPASQTARTAAYGLAFQLGPERLAVTTPGEIIAVSLSDNAMSVGVAHEAGTPELLVGTAGDYLVEFALYMTSDSAKQAVFALQANGSNIVGGVRDVPLRSGYQAVTGSTMVNLEENSHIRIVMTASSPLEVTLIGSGTTAALSVRKL